MIMPFSDLNGVTEKEWTEIFNELFIPAIIESGLGYTCERSDIRNGAFTKDIIQNLKTAKIVLADITHFNANVMWELGVRHALSKRTIIVARYDLMQIISDLKIYGVIPYATSGLTEINTFKKKIKDILTDIENNPERSDSPVFDFIKEEELVLFSFERKQIMNKLIALISEFLTNLAFTETILKNPPSIKDTRVFLHRFQSDAIREIIKTNYVHTDELYAASLAVMKQSMEISNTILNGWDSKNVSEKTIEEFLKIVRDMEKNLRDIIPVTKEILDSVKKGSISSGDPPIMMMSNEHQKLLDGKIKSTTN